MPSGKTETRGEGLATLRPSPGVQGEQEPLVPLLADVLEAHGGREAWMRVERLTARLSAGGPFWEARGWPGIYEDVTASLDAHREHIAFQPFTAPDRSSVLEVAPERIAIRAGDEVLEERVNPRGSYPAYRDGVRWDALQVAYFMSAATWNYLTAPFVLTYPGVEVRELDVWHEDGEPWRRLAVTFPASIANHNAHQIFYFDERFMLRRLDYAPDVTGAPPVAHYTHEPRRFDGFIFPTRRRVHLHDGYGIADQRFAPITIDVHSVAIERH